jgi:hypothetical protein
MDGRKESTYIAKSLFADNLPIRALYFDANQSSTRCLWYRTILDADTLRIVCDITKGGNNTVTATMRFITGLAAAFLAALAFGLPASADGTKVGVLTCNVSSGWGLIFGSSRHFRCNYATGKGYGEHYVGTVTEFGVDVGYTAGGVLIWDVVASRSALGRGALAGSYSGGTASATADIGVGANELVGGFHRSITLQPVSVDGNTGLNVAPGIGAITLHYISPIAR